MATDNKNALKTIVKVIDFRDASSGVGNEGLRSSHLQSIVNITVGQEGLDKASAPTGVAL